MDTLLQRKGLYGTTRFNAFVPVDGAFYGAGHGIPYHIDSPVGQAFGHHFCFIFAAGMAFSCAVITSHHKGFFFGLDMAENFIDGFLDGGMHGVSPQNNDCCKNVPGLKHQIFCQPGK